VTRARALGLSRTRKPRFLGPRRDRGDQPDTSHSAMRWLRRKFPRFTPAVAPTKPAARSLAALLRRAVKLLPREAFIRGKKENLDLKP